jgi:hypothetical protein
VASWEQLMVSSSVTRETASRNRDLARAGGLTAAATSFFRKPRLGAATAGGAGSCPRLKPVNISLKAGRRGDREP